MRITSNTVTRTAVAAMALLASVALTQSARAAEVNVAGSASGAFGGGGTTLGGLSYSGSNFDATSSGGFIGFGGGPSGNVNNFGTFTLGNSPFDYAGNTFTLDLLFTAPTVISGGQGSTYAAKLLGQVGNNNTGGVFIDFDDAPQVFNFSGASGTGSFTLFVNNLSVNPGLTASVTGTVVGANQTAIPEPSTLALVGMGMMGTFGVARRRKPKA